MNPSLRIALFLVACGGFASACKSHPPAASAPATATASAPATATASASGRVSVTLDDDGYHPSTVHAPAGRPLTLVFTRTTESTCGQRVVFPSLHLERDLPRNQPVEITVTPTTGTLAFACGMDMLHGSIVAQ